MYLRVDEVEVSFQLNVVNWSCVYLQTLEKNWKTIRDEALAVMDQNTGLFIPEEENLREKGEWGQYTLWQQGTHSNIFIVVHYLKVQNVKKHQC